MKIIDGNVDWPLLLGRMECLRLISSTHPHFFEQSHIQAVSKTLSVSWTNPELKLTILPAIKILRNLLKDKSLIKEAVDTSNSYCLLDDLSVFVQNTTHLFSARPSEFKTLVSLSHFLLRYARLFRNEFCSHSIRECVHKLMKSIQLSVSGIKQIDKSLATDIVSCLWAMAETQTDQDRLDVAGLFVQYPDLFVVAIRLWDIIKLSDLGFIRDISGFVDMSKWSNSDQETHVMQIIVSVIFRWD